MCSVMKGLPRWMSPEVTLRPAPPGCQARQSDARVKRLSPTGHARMKCPRCQHESPPGAKFCAECGGPLVRDCARCGARLPAGAKFCPECAQPVAVAAARETRFASPVEYTPKHIAEKVLRSRSALEGERKQVTVLFADLKGSMELLAHRDPE